MTYHATVSGKASIAVPPELLEELGLSEGDSVLFERNERGMIMVRSFAQIVREEQRRFRDAVGPDYSVDHFLADRAADWGEA